MVAIGDIQFSSLLLYPQFEVFFSSKCKQYINVETVLRKLLGRCLKILLRMESQGRQAI